MLRYPIRRIGYAGALELLTQKGYRLVGRELISPEKSVHQVTRYMYSDAGSAAEFHVTSATKERLLAALKAK